jgi:fumarylacetoacetate (FAA) hydrolase
MKFASYKDGSRDGQLVVVSRDLTQAHFPSHVANKLQQVLDDWNYLSPQLQDVYDALNAGRARHAFPFDPSQCLAPLPRAYQRVESVAFAAGDAPSEPVMVQACSDSLSGPRDPMVCGSVAFGPDFEAGLAVITSDIPMGCPSDRALEGVRLLALANSLYLRTVAPSIGSQPSTAFSPVAVTPDELGEAWSRGRVHLTLQTTWNGRKVGMCEAGSNMTFHFGQLIAHLCRTRRLRAGSIIGSGAVANQGTEKKGRWDWPLGYNSIAAKRAMEAIQDGQPSTDYLQAGDTVRVEMKGRDGHSVFGAIEQEVSLLPAAAQKS